MASGPFLHILQELASESALAGGLSDYRQGRVRQVELRPTGVLEAVVDGADAYEVSIQLHASGFRTDCSCPVWHREQMCRHVVALAHLADDEELSLSMTRALTSGDSPAPNTAARDAGDNPSPRTWRPPSWRARLAALEDGARRRREQSEEYERPATALYEIWIEPEECRQRGGLVLSLTRRTVRKNGRTGEPKESKWSSVPTSVSMSRASQLALNRVQKLGKDDVFGWRWNERSKLFIPPTEAARVLATLDGVVSVRIQEDDGTWSEPVQWSPDPWYFELTLRASREDGEPVYRLDGSFRRGAVRRALSDARLLLPRGVALFDDTFAPLVDAQAFEWVTALLDEGSIEARGADAAPFLERLLDLAVGIPLELGALAEAGPAPSPILDLSLPVGKPAEGDVTFVYGDQEVAAKELSPYVLRKRDGVEILRRDLDAEAALLEGLIEAGVERLAPGESEHAYRMPLTNLPEHCATLLKAGWQVRVERKPLKTGNALSMRVRSGIDWFDLEAQAEFDSTALNLPDILRAVSEGKGFLTLDDGGAALLPPEWTARLQALSAMTEQVEGSDAMRLPKARGPLLDVLLADLGPLETDDGYDELRQSMHAFDRVRARREPASFHGELRPYQRESLGWFAFLRKTGLGGCLADDMGLGKTVQVLATLLSRRRAKDRRGPSLVVAPRSVMSNWVHEAARFAPSLRVAAYHGPGREVLLRDTTRLDLIVTTYGTMRRDAEHLADIAFDYVVLDESQAIKNPTSKTARAAYSLDAAHRLALSGTPIENHLDELGSLFHFLNPGLLGNRREFQALLGASDAASSKRMGWLRAALRPVVLRRTREQVLTELPELEEQLLRCPLGAEQRDAYDGIREHYRASVLARVDESGLGRTKMHVLEALLRLRQAACHPGLIDSSRKADASAKLDQLMPMLEEIADAGHKALVFSQFTQFLGIVRGQLEDMGIRYEYLDGKTTKRADAIRRFQKDPDTSAFLISLKAGGTGLNLTAAQYVFILDPWWNPAVEAQAVGRAHRMGQANPVTVYRLIGEDTIEERVLDLQDKKRALAEAVLGEVSDAPLRGMTREDLELLLG